MYLIIVKEVIVVDTSIYKLIPNKVI